MPVFPMPAYFIAHRGACAIAALMFAAILAGCSQGSEPPVSKAKVEPIRPVHTIIVAPQSLTSALSLPADIRPRFDTRYGFRVGGKLAMRSVSVGDRVSPGQVLARLDPTDLAPQVNAAQANLDAANTDAKLAQTELGRLKELRDKNFISQSQVDRQQAVLDSARSRVESAQASLKQARNALDFQVLKADVNGVVIAVEAEAGQVLAAGQPVIRVARLGDLEANLNIPEPQLAAARKVSQWQVVLPALGARAVVGTLREVSPTADPASRTFTARLTLSGNLADINWGMTAIAVAPGASASELLVPIAALHTQNDEPRVWLLDRASATVKGVKVTTGGFIGESVRVTSGIKPGDEIVTAGANLLIEGQKVKFAAAAK
jgi:membrane fusion protein, multidrug efflux system